MRRRTLAWLLLFCLLLTGCQTAPAETEPPVNGPAPTEQVWEPFTGAVRLYSYYHEDGEARDWEEDIIHMSELYLDDYTQLTPFPSRVQTRDDVYYDTERYSEELREYCLTRINNLIPRLEGMAEKDILFYLQETVAACHDAHLEVYVNADEFFPLMTEPLYHEDGSYGLYVVLCEQSREELLYTRLTAVNNIPIEEVITLLEPWISYENEYWLLQRLAYPVLMCPEYLRQAGIMGPEESKARFTLESSSGVVHSVTLTAMDMDAFSACPTYSVAMSSWEDHPMNAHKDETNYYFEYNEEQKTVYARIHRFEETPDYTVLQFGNELLALDREQSGIHSLILDLRGNPGGYQSLGFPEFFSVLERMDIGTIYVLIDNGTFSNGVITAGTIDARLENALLVGTPAGQPANFYGSVEDITAPNEKITFRLPGAWWVIQPENTDPALMPDIQILQTLNDYKNGRDTVLRAVWAMIEE